MSSAGLTCYTVGLDYVTSTNQYFPCTQQQPSSGGAIACCAAGDYCMQDSICHYTHSVTNGTGYYMAGCTDPTWQDPACPQQCTSEYSADIIYDTANEEWNCCVSARGYLNCQQPNGTMTVQAPGPDSLALVALVTQAAPGIQTTGIGAISVSSGVSTSSSSATSSAASMTTSAGSIPLSTTPASTPTPDSQTSRPSSTSVASSSNSNTGLAGGGVAGIVVGVIAIFVLLSIGTFFLLRRRHYQRPTLAELDGYNGLAGAKSASELSITRHQTNSSTNLSQPGGSLGRGYPSEKIPLYEFLPAKYERRHHHPAFRESRAELVGDEGRHPVELPVSQRNQLR